MMLCKKEIKEAIKKKLMKYLDTLEVQMKVCIHKSTINQEKPFSEFKQQCLNIHSELTSMTKETSQVKTNQNLIQSHLIEINRRIKNIENSNNFAKSFTDMLDKIYVDVSFDIESILDGIKLQPGDANQSPNYYRTRFDVNEALTGTRSEANIKTKNLQLRKSTMVKTMNINCDIENIGSATDRPRRGSLLKSQRSFALLNKQFDTPDKHSSLPKQALTFSNCSGQIDSQSTGIPSIISLSNNKNEKIVNGSNKDSPSVLNLNLYRPINSLVQRINTESQIQDPKKNLITQFVSKPMHFSIPDKTNTFTLCNSILSQIEFKKIITETLKKNENIDRIDLRNNVFAFDVARCIKDMFKSPVTRGITFDLRCNKIKIDPRNFEAVKKQLSLLHIKLTL